MPAAIAALLGARCAAASTSRSRRAPRISTRCARAYAGERHRRRARDLLRRRAGAARARASRDLALRRLDRSPSSRSSAARRSSSPIAIAADDHQTANARALARAGAALGHAAAAPSRPPRLAAELEALIAAPATLAAAAAAAHRTRPPRRRRASRRCSSSRRWRRQRPSRRGGRGMRALPLDIGTIHFVGIGGIGMSGIAEILHNLGYHGAGQRHRRRRQRAAAAPRSASPSRSATAPRICGEAQVVVISSAVKTRQSRGRRRRARVSCRWCAAPRCWAS